MIKKFFEKNLANYFNKYKQSNGTYEGSYYLISCFFAILFVVTFLTTLGFVEKYFGFPLASLYDSIIPSGFLSIFIPLLISYMSIYSYLTRSDIQIKVCEKYTGANGNEFLFFVVILFLPDLILAIMMQI